MTKQTETGGGRELAFAALQMIEARDAYADIVLDNLFRRRHPPQNHRALATEITYGVLRWRSLLDFMIGRLADRRVQKLERAVLTALRVGAYQLLKMDRVTPAVAVNQSVGLAPQKAKGFVNAVLRKLAASPNPDPALAEIEDPLERLSLAHSHPRWMVELIQDRLGPEAAAALLAKNNLRPQLSLRVNTTRNGRLALLRLFERAGIQARAGTWSPLAVVLESPAPLEALPGFEDGLFAAQDEASQLVPLILDPQPGETILDACAAPGTKSLALMQLMNGRGRVVAVDLHAGRLARMAGEAQRLGLPNVTRVAGDATLPFVYGRDPNQAADPRPSLPARLEGVGFDRVLVDAPCTGLGTIRRRPEIKWCRTADDITRQAKLQRAILDNVKNYLKPGGVLVYSTCTFTVPENEWAVAPLLHSGEFEQENIAGLELPFAARAAIAGLCQDRMLRAWPHLTDSDGFTVFRLRKQPRR